MGGPSSFSGARNASWGVGGGVRWHTHTHTPEGAEGPQRGGQVPALEEPSAEQEEDLSAPPPILGVSQSGAPFLPSPRGKLMSRTERKQHATGWGRGLRRDHFHFFHLMPIMRGGLLFPYTLLTHSDSQGPSVLGDAINTWLKIYR